MLVVDTDRMVYLIRNHLAYPLQTVLTTGDMLVVLDENHTLCKVLSKAGLSFAYRERLLLNCSKVVT